MVNVRAAYTIENPTARSITVDFGFPIVRGIATSPFAMAPTPDVRAELGDQHVRVDVISNSVIYGIIREQARKTIDLSLSKDKTAAPLSSTIRASTDTKRKNAREKLRSYMIGNKGWKASDAALLIEYCSLDLGKQSPGRVWSWNTSMPGNDADIISRNLGPLALIGEQKATQFLAQLASCFDKKAGVGYERIFTAWGGNTQERSVDLKTGKVRPRRFTAGPGDVDPTVYARVDYLSDSTAFTKAEKDSCKAILKDLPIIFTFAPMNLLHYQVTFAPKSTEVLTISYGQYAYKDTSDPQTYQFAYLVHPASMWNSFGPINVTVTVPNGIKVRSSEQCTGPSAGERSTDRYVFSSATTSKEKCSVFSGTLRKKTGEIFVAVDADDWAGHIKSMRSKL
jgi:hypothetical protein